MLNYPRLNEIAHRIEGYTGSNSNYRIVKAELFSEERAEQWSITIQRKEDDGNDFMQEIMNRVKGYQETVHFRVVSAYIKGNNMNIDFVVEDLTEEKKQEEENEDEWEE